MSELVAAAGRAQVRVGEYTPRGGETLEAVDHRLAAFLAELFRYMLTSIPTVLLKLSLSAELSVRWN